MKFTQKTDYALRAMQHLARYYYETGKGIKATAPVSVSVIAKESGLSLRFLHGIVAKLSRDGLLKSVPGPKGGVALSRSPETITILDIVQSVEGKINLMDCLPHPGSCSESTQCSIRGVLHVAQDALINGLRNTNLKLMVKAKSDPFHIPPDKVFSNPQFGCPVLK